MFGPMIDPDTEREIRFLMAQYTHLLDAGEAQAWAALFTPGGRWIRSHASPAAMGGSGIAAGVCEGRAELAGLADLSMRNFCGLGRHQMTDLLLWQAEEGRVRGACRMLITDFRDGPGKVAMVGTYDLLLSPTPAGWRIAELTAEFLPR